MTGAGDRVDLMSILLHKPYLVKWSKKLSKVGRGLKMTKKTVHMVYGRLLRLYILIDWEYPRGPDDRAAFVSLIKELRLAFEGEAESSDNDKLLLTAAVPASFEAIAAGYDVPELSKYLGSIHVFILLW